MKYLKKIFLLLIITLPLIEGCTLRTVEQQSLPWEVNTPAPEGSRQQGLSVSTNGKLMLSWVEGIKPDNWVRFSILEEKAGLNLRP